MSEVILGIRETGGGIVTQTDAGHWRLSIQSGPAGRYRWAQLDDYHALPRSKLPWRPPFTLELRARVSALDLPGTWGFGLWNDPFSMSLGLGGAGRHIPALPNNAWFFHASPPNYLSLRDDLPAQGFFAGTFRSAHLPFPALALGAPILPFLFWPPAARRLRRMGRKLVNQDGARVAVDPREWHTYRIEWLVERMVFWVDDQAVLKTRVLPRAPLGLVIWIDNQFAAFPPSGQFGYGTLSTPEEAWLELGEIKIQ